MSLVKEYCVKKGPNHHVIFLVDEIGHYIADDTQLMLNLQTIVEDLGTACRGKAWVIVTSQEDIDSITKTKGNDFSKIQGRFDTRLSLSASNVDEVIRKRVLDKNETAKQNVEYERMTTAIRENGNIRIESQNYGFDLGAGVREVELELDAERYYMIVKILK